MARRKSYRQELNERKQSSQVAIAKVEKELSDNQMDDKWFEDYRKINHLRVNLMTVKSRIKNLGKKHKWVNTININMNQLKTM